MRFSEKWLREWVNPSLNTQQLADTITMAGLEVDSIEPVAEKFTGVVIGQVKGVSAHPDSNDLKICQIHIGQQAPLTIVCGDATVKKDYKVCVAKIGAYLPAIHQNGETLTQTTIKGIESQGMLCSLMELGLAESSEHIHYVDNDAPVGELLWEYFSLDDKAIEIDLTPNRGDCLSLRGIARELSALTKVEFEDCSVEPVAPQSDHTFPVQIENKEACPLYAGRVINDVDLSRKTPDWMAEKLRRSGLGQINVVVDILNYVMLYCGQPMHAFDLAKLNDSIIVKMAKSGEKLALLDGQSVVLESDTLVIADAKKPVAIAGIMGGMDSSIQDGTTDVFLESAFFSPNAIINKARKYGLHTDSSSRFERGVDPALPVKALEYATKLILEHASGKAGPVVATGKTDVSLRKITLSQTNVKSLLGYHFTDNEILATLTHLGCQCKEIDATDTKRVWEVTAPSHRFDFNLEVDLIEEIVRVHGYQNIPNEALTASFQVEKKNKDPIDTFNHILVANGFFEAITYSFVDPQLQGLLYPDAKTLSLSNPISSDLSQMRLSIWPGLIQALQNNTKRQIPNIKLFESGLVFRPSSTGLAQIPMLSGAMVGERYPHHWAHKAEDVGFYDVKGQVELILAQAGFDVSALTWQQATDVALHPGQSADVYHADKHLGTVGMLHPKHCAKLDLPNQVGLFELNLDYLVPSHQVAFLRPSKYPGVRRDLSLLVPQSQATLDIIRAIETQVGALLQDCFVFDVYEKGNLDKDQKSIAIGMILQDESRTLIEEEVEKTIQEVISMLKQEFGALLRE